MINVLKRLAELDSSKSQTNNKMKNVESLMTVSNSPEVDPVSEITRLAGLRVNECGMMEIPESPIAVAPPAQPHSPASINVSANTGDEVSDMLRSLMAMSGLDKSEPASHQEIEIGQPHDVSQTHGSMGGDMNDLIGMIDANSDGDSEMPFGDEEGGEEPGVFGGEEEPFGDEGDEDPFGGNDDNGGDEQEAPFGDEEGGEDDGVEFGDEEGGEDDTEESMGRRPYVNSPDEEIEGHDYGDKQVTPKPQGMKQRSGDNPYRPAHEAVDSTALRLLRDYKSFVNESIKRK